MKKNTIFRQTKKLAAAFGAVAMMFFASCGGVDSEETPSSVGDKVSVKISVDEQARTALPTVERDEFDSFELKWGDSSEESKKWSKTDKVAAYWVMNSDFVTLTNGKEYTFTLTATMGSGDASAIYTGSVKKKISAEDEELHFTLSLANVPTAGTGSLNITLDYSAVSSSVKKVVAKRYNSTDEVSYSTAEVANTAVLTDSAYTEKDVPCGQYIVEFTFYDEDGLVLSIVPELATILPGKESTSTKTITVLSKPYTITYMLNGGTIEGETAENDTVTAQFTPLSDVILAEPAKENEHFAGWYTKADFAEDSKIVGWNARERAAAITVYAKWQCEVTIVTDASTSEKKLIDEGSKIAKPDDPTKTISEHSFVGWFAAGTTLKDPAFDFDTAITKDMTLTATWVRSVIHINATGNDTTADGSVEKPYSTVTKALEQISGLNEKLEKLAELDFKIVVAGKVTENVKAESTLDGKAKSLLITGEDSSDTDILDGNANGSVLEISTKVPVTVKDITITNGYTSDSGTGGGISITNSDADVTLGSGAVITKNVCTLLSENGAGGVFTEGTLTIDGAEITNNTSHCNGGGVTLKNTNAAKLTMKSGKISGNTMLVESPNVTRGNGVYMMCGSSFTMEGGEISNNTTDATASNCTGGGVNVNPSCTFTMAGGTIRGNTAPSGGGISNYGTFTMTGGSISGNASSLYGGGVYNSSNATFTMKDGTISGNTVAAEVSGNSAYAYGGGVYNESGSTFTMEKGTINKNSVSAFRTGTAGYQAYAYGGGVYNNAMFTMKGGTISENSASAKTSNSVYQAYAYGGGVYSKRELTLEGGTISKNTLSDTYYRYGVGLYSEKAFNMSGGISIPAGDDGKHDAYVLNGIIVTSALAATAPVATVTPSSYNLERKVLFAGEGVTLSDEAKKFAVAQEEIRDKWYIDDNGKLALPVYNITYRDKDDAEFTGTLAEGALETHTYGFVTTLPVPEKDGCVFQGWHKKADCSDPAVTVIEEKDYTEDFTLYARWTHAAATVTFAGDIAVTKSESDGTIAFTAADGYTDYTWLIDQKTPSEGLAGSTVSADGKTLTISKDKLVAGVGYAILLTAKNSYGIILNASVSVKK